MTSIFGSQEPEKTDFQKIGVNTIRPYKCDGRWVFKSAGGVVYDMAPAQLTDMALSPIVVGADRLIMTGCKLKNIENPENGFLVLFSEQWFPGCDVKLVLKENKFDGWLYDVESEELQGLLPGQGAWLCPYMTMFYKEPPKTIYLKMETDHDSNKGKNE